MFKRVERFGFAAFFLGFFLIAIGIRQGIQDLWVAGAAIVGVVFLIAIARAVRGAWGKPRRPVVAEPANGSSARRVVPRPPEPGVTRADDV